MPASWPSVTASTSRSRPWRSAQRRYIRSSISAQSWASVPPAPEWISHTASWASWGSVNSDRSSTSSSRADSLARFSPTSASTESSSSSTPSCQQGLGVVEATDEVVVGVEVVADGGELGLHPAGQLGVVPQVGAGELGLELRATCPQLGDGQIPLGLGEPAPQRGDLVGEVLHGSPTSVLRRRSAGRAVRTGPAVSSLDVADRRPASPAGPPAGLVARLPWQRLNFLPLPQ